MRAKRSKWSSWLALGACGTAFQFVPLGNSGGCIDFGLQFGLAVFDTCSILNCTDGTFVNFCDPVITLVDCPNIEFDDAP